MALTLPTMLNDGSVDNFRGQNSRPWSSTMFLGTLRK